MVKKATFEHTSLSNVALFLHEKGPQELPVAQ